MADFDGLPVPRRYWSAGAIWLALTMAVLDGAIANVALPTMARELSAARDQSVWVVNGFQLAVVVSLLPLAALGEMIGYRRVFLAGVALFTAASLACALAQSLPILIFTRVVQGLGAGCIMSVNGALVRFTYPSNQLGRGVGLNALVVSAAAAFGPTVASAILALGPWEWLFAVNVPIGVLTFFVGRASLPMSAASGRLDLSSTLLNIATFGFGFIGIDLITRDGGERLGGAALALATVTGVTLILRSRARPRPLVPIDLLRNKIFALSVTTSIASFSAQMLAFVSLPFYLQGVLHRSQVDTGLLMTPWPLAAGVAAAFAGRLADRLPAPNSQRRRPRAARAWAAVPGAAAERRDLPRGRLAHGDMRLRVWLLSIAQQSHNAFIGADGAERRGGRYAGNGAADRPDDRGDARRHLLSLRLSRRTRRANHSGRVRRRRRCGEPRAPSAHAYGSADRARPLRRRALKGGARPEFGRLAPRSKDERSDYRDGIRMSQLQNRSGAPEFLF